MKEIINVLLVGLAKDSFHFCDTVLENSKPHITTASSFSESMHIISSKNIDFIITETYLVDSYGIDLLCWVENKYPQIKSILITDDINILTSKNISNSNYEILVKPYRQSDLNIILSKIYSNSFAEPEQISKQEFFLELSFEELIVGSKANMSLYLRLSIHKHVKIVNKGEAIDSSLLERYKARGVRSVFVEAEEYNSYLELGLRASHAVKDKINLAPHQKTKFFIHISDTLQEKIYKTGFDKNDFIHAQSFVLDTLEVASKNKSIMDLLQILKTNCNSHYAHSLAVSIYSVLLAKKLEWTTEKTINIMALGSFVHDVGIKNFPEELKSKPKHKFSEEELKSWENHTLLGAEILTRVENIPKEVFQIIMQHHERNDGSGYPFGLTGANIFPLAKVVALIDSFTYMVLPDQDHLALTPREAITYISTHQQNKFDTKMIKELEGLIAS